MAVGTVRGSVFACPACGSGLIAQTEPHFTSQEHVTRTCRACGVSPELQVVIEVALEESLSADAYLRTKDEGASGPIYTCPACGAEAFVDFEGACAVCGYATEETDCVRCGTTLILDDLLYAETGLSKLLTVAQLLGRKLPSANALAMAPAQAPF